MVLAREDAGAEKIFRSNGVQLLQRLLDTGEADLMLAALRTLVGICSEHQSRVGGPEGAVTASVRVCVPPATHPPSHPSLYLQKQHRQSTRGRVMREEKLKWLQKTQHDWDVLGPVKAKAAH